jgi:16S rRNA C967 or C1407 C5-methylase (RsmB/RsmF family)
MRALQALLVDAAEQGLISRQEAVSMIPPLFLKVCKTLESLLRTAAGGRHSVRPLP